MTRKFEAHLTFDKSHAVRLQEFAEDIAISVQVKFSQIDGDAQMGAKPFCYLTSYHADGRQLAVLMANVSLILDAQYQIQTLRTKIEEIVYDTKTGHNVLL